MMAPETPFTFIVEVPAATPAVVTVMIALLPGITGFGAKVTVEPVGLPVALSVTGSTKPWIEPILTVYTAGAGAQTSWTDGVTPSEKLGANEHCGNLNEPMRVLQLKE